MIPELDHAARKRFWSKVVQSDGCWEWQGRRHKNGYGVFDLPGHDGRPEWAHRVSPVIDEGPIPPGVKVLHTCDNPPCVRPDHLYRGTQKDNTRDAMERGRWSFTVRVGESNGQAKLTKEIVLAMREMYATGNFSQSQVAERFGSTRAAVCDVVRRKSWRHV